MSHNRPVTFREWFEVSPGLWWWEKGPDALARAVGVDGGGLNARRAVSVVPAGAPLLGRATPIDNCRTYAHLFGYRRTSSEIFTCLRTVEIPDRAASRRAGELNELQRTLTWLAMARMAATSVIVLLEPPNSSSKAQRDQLRRVLQEATEFHSHIFVATHHRESAASLGAHPVPTFVGTEP